jgi:hypothetical protein
MGAYGTVANPLFLSLMKRVEMGWQVCERKRFFSFIIIKSKAHKGNLIHTYIHQFLVVVVVLPNPSYNLNISMTLHSLHLDTHTN